VLSGQETPSEQMQASAGYGASTESSTLDRTMTAGHASFYLSHGAP
jgi:hypothetical protein